MNTDIMYEASSKARDMFKLYAELHRAKSTVDSDTKAKVNEDMTINEALSVHPAGGLILDCATEIAKLTAERDALKERAEKAERMEQLLCSQVDALRAALLDTARRVEALKRPCGMDPESAQAIRNGEYMSIALTARAAIASATGEKA